MLDQSGPVSTDYSSLVEERVISQVLRETKKNNVDNITRTKAYLQLFIDLPEMKWAFLAHMVSRNGGWNMCDLEGEWFPKIIDPHVRKLLFLTYERANWLIFHDAYPQLLLYLYSTKMDRPMFHLLTKFHISAFMIKEWNRFWKKKDMDRLMVALIVNEQNVIQNPVICHPVYKKRVFHSLMFFFQDWLHFSSVLFPTCKGQLFGASVNGFRSVNKRIGLGKRLATILFDPELFPQIFEFACVTEHTGSRYDYEQYFFPGKRRNTPFLRTTYPVIEHHKHKYEDWFSRRRFNKKWLQLQVTHRHPICLTDWYDTKQKQMHAYISVRNLIGGKSF